jgi:hypothetical protein
MALAVSQPLQAVAISQRACLPGSAVHRSAGKDQPVMPSCETAQKAGVKGQPAST